MPVLLNTLAVLGRRPNHTRLTAIYKGMGVRRVIDQAFCEYGLPAAIRTDKGVPFATTGIGPESYLRTLACALSESNQARSRGTAAMMVSL